MSCYEKHAQMTVGLLSVQDTDEAALNEILGTLMGQDISSFELLICPDIANETLVQQIIEDLYLFPTESCVRTVIHPLSYESGAAEAMEWMIQNAAGEFVVFHTLSETLYDAQVLSRYWQAFQGRGESLGLMRTLVYRKSDQTWKILPEMEAYGPLAQASPEEHVRLLSAAGKELCNGGICFRRAALSEPHFSNGTYPELLFSAMLSAGRDGVLVLAEYCATRHYCKEFPENRDLAPLYTPPGKIRTTHRDVLNLTDYLALETAVQAALEICGGPFHKPDIPARKALSEKLTRLCGQMRAKSQGGVWGITDSRWQLLRYLEKLILLLELPGRRVSDYKMLLADAREKAYSKFKVVFFANEYTIWPSLQSVYEAVQAAPDMEAQLVYLPFRHISKTVPDAAELEAYRAAGYQPLSHDHYNIAEECPDAAVYVKPYDEIPRAFTIGETHRAIPRCLYIPYCMEVVDDLENTYYQCRCPMQFHAWRIAAYCKDYYEKMRKCTYTQGKNYLLCGHPRIDLRFHDYSGDAAFRAIRQKAGNRKIVLWNTHFFSAEGDRGGTFSLFKDAVLNYFDMHTELFLLWRPHPLFYGALAQAEGKPLSEIDAWFQAMQAKENYYIDRSASYLPSFAVSDAMVSDQASFVPEYLSWGKPLIVTHGPGTSGALYRSLKPHLHYVEKQEDIIAFLETIRTTDLPAPSVSEEVAKEIFVPREGTVGGYLAEYLSRQIRKEQAELLEKL